MQADLLPAWSTNLHQAIQRKIQVRSILICQVLETVLRCQSTINIALETVLTRTAISSTGKQVTGFSFYTHCRNGKNQRSCLANASIYGLNNLPHFCPLWHWHRSPFLKQGCSVFKIYTHSQLQYNIFSYSEIFFLSRNSLAYRKMPKIRNNVFGYSEFCRKDCTQVHICVQEGNVTACSDTDIL